jgi:hypothetical protein
LIRIWGHEVEKDLAGIVDRVKALLVESLTQDGDTRHEGEGQSDLR